ncbi:hypothetical protein [Roseospira goensis]|uniref:Lipoprotein n=1 Tax=Roseospira goensis TaxID=391922 RepID=A0A7W6RYQ3_9PROT|nr:hypothetical protein [Roseospira goensis]MBB4285708.1 hypothetical protein [Roseospira goensis]
MTVTPPRLALLGLAAAAPLLLGACGAPHLKTVRAAQEALVGQDVALLARCIGEPLAVQQSADGTPTAYVYSSAQPRGPDGRLRADPAPDLNADPDRHARACVFDVAVQDGRILAVRSDNRAGWGFGSITKCSAVVKRCTTAQALRPGE